jgi:hypothetical protein
MHSDFRAGQRRERMHVRELFHGGHLLKYREGVVGWQQRRVDSWHPPTRNRYAYRSYLSLDTND